MTRMSPEIAAPARSVVTRDLRIDALRGAALVMIFVDHIRGNFFGHLTYQQFGLSNGAWLFVLLAGMSFALKYSKLLDIQGLGRSALVALDRVRVLYLAHLVSFVLAVGCWAALAQGLGRQLSDLSQIDYLDLLVAQPFAALPRLLTLTYQPQFFDILPMYMVLIAAGPFLLYGLRRAPLPTVVASLLCYLAAQVAPVATNLPLWNRPTGWSFNLMAWQLLFTIGLALGAGMVPAWRSDRQRRVVVTCAFVFVVNCAVCRVLSHVPAIHAWLGGDSHPLVVRTERVYLWASAMHPITVVHVLAVVLLLHELVPRNGAVAHSRWLQPLVDLGSHSLEVFVTGLVLTGLATELVLVFKASYALQLVLNVAGIVVMWLVARALIVLKRAQKPAPMRREALAPPPCSEPALR
jgi:hypothetical protein